MIQPATHTSASRVVATVTCSHCGLPVPKGLITPKPGDQFCCAGCRAAHDLIHGCGLDTYYHLRETGRADAPRADQEPVGYDAYDDEAFARRYVTRHDEAAASIDLTLEGVHCAACVWLIEKLPRLVPGVLDARLSLREGRVRVTWDPSCVKLSAIARTLATLGYRPHPGRDLTKRQIARREERQQLIRIGVAGALAGNVMLLAFALYAGMFSGIEREYAQLFRWVSMGLGVLSLAWPGRVFFRGAWVALRTRSPHLDLPIALALGVGGVAGVLNVVLGRGEIYFDSLCVLVFLLLVGRFIQFRQQRKADAAVDLLMSLTPTTCRRVTGGTIEQVPIDAVEAGDLLEVHPNELMPADGEVVSGSAWVVASLITGESQPVPVAVGDSVCGGSQLKGSSIRIQVTAVGASSRVGRLMAQVSECLAEKPAMVGVTDRIAGWFVVVVSALALVVFSAWSLVGIGPAVDHTVALLIVACPCALGLATPLTFAVAIGRSARRDTLIKSGAAMDRLAQPGRLLLDKTGTLTRGQMQVDHWRGDETLQPLLPVIQQQAGHPIARAVVQAYGHIELPADQRARVGPVTVSARGVSAPTHRGTLAVGSVRYIQEQRARVPARFWGWADHLAQRAFTPVLVAEDGVVVAVFGVGDTVYSDAEAALDQLGRWGWRVEMLTGDCSAVAEHVADQIGLPKQAVNAEVSPEQKLAAAKRRVDDRPVVMVGDGVNDAAALAAADVGIAVSGGAEASLAAADIYLGRPGLATLVEVIATARQTRRTIRRNLALSLGYNALAVSLAAAGLINPLVAAVLMPLSSVTVLALAMSGQAKAVRLVDGPDPRSEPSDTDRG
ncbi:MAG: heavy metal translocating P-type ATPase [Planctomycetota bacterium]